MIRIDNDVTHVEFAPSGTTLAVANQEYACPVHGHTPHVIVSNIGFAETGKNTYWCMLCALEAMEKLGVPRVEPRVK